MTPRHALAIAAAVAAAFAALVPMSWPHRAGFILATILLSLSWVAATFGAMLRRLLRPHRHHYSARDLDRAYRAGHDTGAAEGPTDATRRRWAREGFDVPSPHPHTGRGRWL